MKKPKTPKESAKVKVDIKALKKLLKKIDVRSSVVSVIGLVVLVGVLSSVHNYASIGPSNAQIPPLLNGTPPESPSLPPLCGVGAREVAITCFNDWQSNPAIYGDIVVWTDERNGNSEIFVKDLSNPTYPRYGKKLTNNNGNEAYPDIYQNLVVWEDRRNGRLNADIYMINIESGDETLITGAPKEQINPKIYGHYIVWEDYRDDPGISGRYMADIYAYDLAEPDPAKREIRITNTPDKSEAMPDIWNNIVVFNSTDGTNNQYSLLPLITVYDLASEATAEISIPSTTGGHTRPTIDKSLIKGGQLVWIETSATFPHTYVNMYLATVTTTDDAITVSKGFSLPLNNPLKSKGPQDIQGNRIVWEESYDIYAYNLNTGVETRVTTNSSSQIQPAVFGNRIVWTDYRNVTPPPPYDRINTDIYMRELW